MNNYKIIIKNIDESLVYYCKGEFKNNGFYLDKFNFIFKGNDSILIENSIPVLNKIPLKKDHLFSFNYHSQYGDMLLQSKLLSFEYSEVRMEIEYQLYQNGSLIGNYKIELERRDKLS